MESVLERLIALQSEMNSLILEVTKQVRGVEPVEKRKVGRPKKIVLVKEKEPYKMTDEHKAKLKAGREAKKTVVPETEGMNEPVSDESIAPTLPVSDESTPPHEPTIVSDVDEKLACHREPPQSLSLRESLSCPNVSNELKIHVLSSPSPIVSADKPKIKLTKNEPRRICRICVTDLQQNPNHNPCIGTAFNEGRFKSVAEWEEDCIEFAKGFK